MSKQQASRRLASIRRSILRESVSYSEISELQSLVGFIRPGDILLAQWAGIPEEEFCR